MTYFEKSSFCSRGNLYKLNAKNIKYNTIIGEKQKLLKIYYFYTLLLFVVYIIDVSNKLNKNVSVKSLELVRILSFLLCVSSDMDINPFITSLKIYTPISNLKLK